MDKNSPVGVHAALFLSREHCHHWHAPRFWLIVDVFYSFFFLYNTSIQYIVIRLIKRVKLFAISWNDVTQFEFRFRFIDLPLTDSKLLNVQNWCCWQQVILTTEWATAKWVVDQQDQQACSWTGWVLDRCYAGKIDKCVVVGFFFCRGWGKYESTHIIIIHPSENQPSPPVLSLYTCTTISGGMYIHTYAHKSSVNLLVTQIIMTFRHKLYSICSTNYYNFS